MSDRTSLGRRLAALAAELDRARTPDVTPAVVHRLREGVLPTPAAKRPFMRRGLVLGLAVLALGATAAFAASRELRDSLLDLVGLRGVEVEQVPRLPPAPPGAEDAGERVSLAEAERRAPFELRRIDRAAFREPERVQARELDGTTAVSFAFAPRRGVPRSPHTDAGLLFTQLRARVDQPVLRKLAVTGGIDPLRVRGSRGYWLGGGDHVLTYRIDGRSVQSRLAGNVLVWQDGAVTLRIEAEVPKRRALAIARAVR